MTSLKLKHIALVLLGASARATRIRIDVGSNGRPALVFSPNMTKAQVGDILDFHFVDENVVSSVVRGLPGSPCKPIDPSSPGFFNSGFIIGDPTGSNIFSVRMNDTQPMAIYCSVGAHCQAGMVAVVNPVIPTDLDAYAAAAKDVAAAVVPQTPLVGGTFQQGVSGGRVQVSMIPNPAGGGSGASSPMTAAPPSEYYHRDCAANHQKADNNYRSNCGKCTNR